MNDQFLDIKEQLFAMQDPGYKAFHEKLIPTVDPSRVIGVRTPALRKFAREFAKDPRKDAFLKDLPHTYYEEDNLHGFLIERIRDFDSVTEALDRFLPYVDNWATCDMLSPKILKTDLPRLYEKILEWIRSEHVYMVRFGLKMLMDHFLDDAFSPETLAAAASVHSEEYYLKMMVAWYFSTALAKQYEATLPYITENRLEPWVHNKTIQKAVESYRIRPEQKEFLKTFRIRKAR
ncbi:MAG: DNA alkylation repair protein [Firmicutes bacterium]|nr:DNA alkylation repair protein [Bacillota bacterium]